MKALFQNPRRLWLAIFAAVVGVALFAGGAFAGSAVDDDDDSPPAAANIEPGGSTGASPAIARPANLGANPTGDASTDSRMSYPGWVCNVPIPGILKDGKVDPALAGFATSYLGSAFDLTGFSVRGQSADCKDGTPSGDVIIVVDTQWKHRDTGLGVYINQSQDAKAHAAVLDETTARFSKDGYAFNVSVDGYSVQPLAADDRAPEKPLLPGADPRAREVLRAALADLQAPAESCFYVARQGSWEDLAAAGVGDPRSAVPSNFAFQELQVTAWTPPAAGCNTPSEGLGITFNASWNYTGTDRGFGALYVSASSMDPQAEKYPGSAGDYGANWTNGKYQFGVGFKVEQQAGLDGSVIIAIARLLDPSFDTACISREQPLTAGELAALGIGTPSAAGYTVKAIALVTTKLQGDCSGYNQTGLEGQARAHWQLRNGTAVIEASAYKNNGPAIPEKERGWISDSSIAWQSGSISYNVNGWVEGGGTAPSRDTLIEVAKSMDPSFDASTLTEQPGGGVPGSPPIRPAADAPATR